MYKKIDELKEPPIVGETYLVPCIVRRQSNTTDWRMVNGEPVLDYVDKVFVTPVINRPHSDKENGQPEVHYHVDYRFLKLEKGEPTSDPYYFPRIRNKHSKYYFCEKIRPQEILDGDIRYFPMPILRNTFIGVTPVGAIKKSNLKHKCIHKGKCPHRGMDLSQVTPVDGVITCPLHGLMFHEITKELLNPPK